MLNGIIVFETTSELGVVSYRNADGLFGNEINSTIHLP